MKGWTEWDFLIMLLFCCERLLGIERCYLHQEVAVDNIIPILNNNVNTTKIIS